MLWRLTLAITLCGQLKAAHGFGIYIKNIGLRRIINADFHGPILISLIPGFVILGPFGHVDFIKPAIVDIGLHLIGVRRTAPFLLARLAAEPNQRSHTWAALVIDDVICVVFVFGGSVVIDKALEP